MADPAAHQVQNGSASGGSSARDTAPSPHATAPSSIWATRRGWSVEQRVGGGVRLVKGACGEAGKVAHGLEHEAGRPIFQHMTRLVDPKTPARHPRRPWTGLTAPPSPTAWPALGAEVVRLKSDRLTGLPDTYRDAKTTMALVSPHRPAAAACNRSRPRPIGGSTWRRAARRIASTATSPGRWRGRRSSASMPTFPKSWPNLPRRIGAGPGDLGVRRTGRGGYHLRMLLLHRPAGAGTPHGRSRHLHRAFWWHGMRRGAVALHHQVRRRGAAAEA